MREELPTSVKTLWPRANGGKPGGVFVKQQIESKLEVNQIASLKFYTNMVQSGIQYQALGQGWWGEVKTK